jgi:hypothetical protein
VPIAHEVLGLARLREFVMQYRGLVRVFSEAAYARIGERSIFGPATRFPGTLVEISISTAIPSVPTEPVEIRL